MVTAVHFISGLPRSGSTLLSALLRQNPRFAAAMTSPVAPMCAALHKKMCGGEFGVFFDDTKRAVILRGISVAAIILKSCSEGFYRIALYTNESVE